MCLKERVFLSDIAFKREVKLRRGKRVEGLFREAERTNNNSVKDYLN